MAKRKRSVTTAATPSVETPQPPISTTPIPLPSERSVSKRGRPSKVTTNPENNRDIVDAPEALRASPDGEANQDILPPKVEEDGSDSPLSDVPAVEPPTKKARSKAAPKKAEPVVNGDSKPAATPKKPAAKAKKQDEDNFDPEAEEGEEADEEEIKQALSRPPPVNSSYLPLPWKGRIGYACLNTYLRNTNPPIFCSRTCRIASIIEHRHPLKDPSQPEHATKNRPDKEKPADMALGRKYVEDICLANIRDLPKMIRWNDRYGIKFMRLSSEMFPFASHEEYGYKLAPFAAEALAEVGKVIAELGHRVTTHPGQFTQLGSPRKQVIDNAFRDLEYHDEMLSLLKLPPQMDRDAVMILHLGGVFGDKGETLNRFRENYAKLSQSVKNRLVLENDDVSWSVHDLLPLCKELNIPFVLDYHHHNIIFDADKIREGTEDIQKLYPEILATWERKNITPKMHYSEPCPDAITGRQRRKHSPRVMTLPPCPPTMDLMIEAKDKEQAVFELMRTFKLPGFETFNDITPHVRNDDNRPSRFPKPTKKTPAKQSKKVKDEEDDEDALEKAASDIEADAPPQIIPEEEIGMGGPEGRVYWPPTMEEWLRPKKREVKKKVNDDGTPILTLAQKKKVIAMERVMKEEGEAKAAKKATPKKAAVKEEEGEDEDIPASTKKAKTTPKSAASQKGKKTVLTPTPSESDDEEDGLPDEGVEGLDEEETGALMAIVEDPHAPAKKGARQSRRAKKTVGYAEEDDE